MRYEAHKNLFIEKILKNGDVWIDFTLTRFDPKARSMRQRVASAYAESNGIFGNFLRRLLKICIQIKWMCQLKRYSLALLIHNNLFCSHITRTGCVFLCWIQWYFWKFSTTIIKDLYNNKVNCVKTTNRQTNTEVFWEYSTLVKAFSKTMELIHIICSA